MVDHVRSGRKPKIFLKSLILPYLWTLIPSFPLMFYYGYVIENYTLSVSIIGGAIISFIWPISLSTIWDPGDDKNSYIINIIWMIVSYGFFIFAVKFKYNRMLDETINFRKGLEEKSERFNIFKNRIASTLDDVKDQLHFINKSIDATQTHAEEIELRKQFIKINDLKDQLKYDMMYLDNLMKDLIQNHSSKLMKNIDPDFSMRLLPKDLGNEKLRTKKIITSYSELINQTYNKLESKINLTRLFDKFSKILSDARPGAEIPTERISEVMQISKIYTVEFLKYINTEYPSLGKFILIEDVFVLSSKLSDGFKIDVGMNSNPFDSNLLDVIDSRSCCKLHGRLGDSICNICGKIIPKEMIIEK